MRCGLPQRGRLLLLNSKNQKAQSWHQKILSGVYK